MKWDKIIQEKTSELGRYLSGRSRTLDLSDLSPVLERTDGQAIRKKILGLSLLEAEKLGISRSTLHYLRKNASDKHPFKVYSKTRNELSSLIKSVGCLNHEN
jgi:hypothetical protein